VYQPDSLLQVEIATGRPNTIAEFGRVELFFTCCRISGKMSQIEAASW
jgi:hypothetical protein